MKKHYI